MEEPKTISNYLEEHAKKDNRIFKSSNDDDLILIYNRHDLMPTQKHVPIEKVAFSMLSDSVCMHCCNKDKDTDVITCVLCYKCKMLHGISGYYGKILTKRCKK